MIDYRVQPALVLDLDGTVRYNKDNPRGFINGPETVAIYDDVAPRVREYRDKGFMILGVTNQGGVAHGYKTMQEAQDENDLTMNILAEQVWGDSLADSAFDAVMYCPFMVDGTVEPYDVRSLLRKPQIGMLAVIEYDMYINFTTIIDWDRSIMVGDRLEDKELAQNANLYFISSDAFFGREK